MVVADVDQYYEENKDNIILFFMCAVDPADFCLVLIVTAQAQFTWLVEDDHVIVYCLLYLPIPEYMNLLAFKISAHCHMLLNVDLTEPLGVDLMLRHLV